MSDDPVQRPGPSLLQFFAKGHFLRVPEGMGVPGCLPPAPMDDQSQQNLIVNWVSGNPTLNVLFDLMGFIIQVITQIRKQENMSNTDLVVREMITFVSFETMMVTS